MEHNIKGGKIMKNSNSRKSCNNSRKSQRTQKCKKQMNETSNNSEN